jgi:type VI secretion system secreted protein VgrG
LSTERTRFYLDCDAGRFTLAQLEVSEALGEPYEARLVFSGDITELQPTALLGTDVTLTIDREGATREVRGIVARVERSSSAVEGWDVRATVRPAFALLAQGSNCRVFQEQSAKEILELLLGEALSPYGRSAEVRTDGSFPTREYCVQYRESDYAFACRLMQEEGISFHFDHDGERELMVLTDSNGAFEKRDGPESGAFRFAAAGSGMVNDELVTDFVASNVHGPTQIAVRDHDWTHPRPIEATQGGPDAAQRTRERYLHGHDVTFSEYSRSYGAHDQTRQAGLQRELDATRELTIQGRSHILGLAAGDVIEIANHELPDLDGEYLVTRVVHGSIDDSANRYANAFTCIRKDVTWRPPRTAPKPRIPSVQSAVVVGPSGEEIHTDEHGRVKVQFHWDRVGAKDEHDFVSGNPDRPRVIGAVYNNENLPPYALPDEKTKSTIKSNSSIGGGGFNELRFEDKAGSEEVYLHAQKDFNETVLNDHNTDVGNNQTNTVMVDQTEDVGANQKMTVGANRTVHIKGAYEETIDASEKRTVSAGSKETISGGEKRTVTGGLNESINGGEKRTVTGGLTENISAAHEFTVTATSTETINGALTQTITGGATITTPAKYDITALGGLNVIAPAGSSIRTEGRHTTIAAGGNTFVDTFYDRVGAVLKDLFSAKVAMIGLYTEESVVLRYRAGLVKAELWAKKVDVSGVFAESKGKQLKVNKMAAARAALIVHLGFTDIDP